jgi:translation initiation factor IF-2
MAKIRAYKLAEELDIDRNEFVEKAAELGVELKNAMAALEPEDAQLLREKLGGASAKTAMVEKRVDRKGGAAVIRRRKKVAPVEPPAPELQPDAEPQAAAIAAEKGTERERAPAPQREDALAEAEALFARAEEAQPGAQPEAPARATAAEPAKPAETPARAPKPRREGEGPEPERPAAPSDPRKGKQRKRVREVVNLREQEQFARQVTSRGAASRRATVVPARAVSPRRRRRDAPAPRPAASAAKAGEQKRVVRVAGEINVGELAKQLGAKAAQLQAKLMALGIMVSVNQSVDVDTVRQIASDYGFEVQDTGFKEEEFLDTVPEEVEEEAGELSPRPPVITVMGHVDHGKTSLLDAIRNAKVVEGEFGGITQHIGAYQARAGSSTLTFIDTPGHAAFTQMRARGAQITDIAVLVVAASEGVMPQTVEAINHARAAGCPIVVAVNKIDLPDADPQRTRQKLMEHDLIPEEFGGDIICVNVSAKSGEGLDQLLEMLSLQAELLELKADPTRRASGVVLEAELDKGRGPVATVLVQNGALHRGDILVAGTDWGRVRLMENERGERLKEAGPSVPVRVIGLSGVPEAGAGVYAVENEKVAKQIIGHRAEQEREKPAAPKPKLSLEDFFAQAESEGPKTLPVVLKADVHGTSEAVREALEKLSTDKVKLDVLSAGVGGISESDVMLAKASDAIVVGFNVRPDPAARRSAEGQGVEIRNYQVIYELIDDVKAAMAGLLPPTLAEKQLGRAEVRETFNIPRVGTIAGCHVAEGLIRRNAQCRLVRDGVQIYQGRVGSLKRFKEDAREVQSGFECGIGIEGYNDVKIGDVIEVFEIEEQPASL